MTTSARCSVQAKRAALKPELGRVFSKNFVLDDVRKVRRQMLRDGVGIVRFTVERLMREMGLQGVIRGKPVRTMVQDKAAPCPLDQVNRVSHAPVPNVLWLSDFTHVSTWSGFVYLAFVIDAHARSIVGWRVLCAAHAGFVLGALEKVLHDRRSAPRSSVVHHSERGSQYVSIKYTERLAEAGIEPSVGSVGGSYDNALVKRSTASAKPRSSIGGDRSAASKPSSSRHWNGSIGSIIAGCWSRSATSRRPKPRNASTLCSQSKNGQRDSSQNAAGNAGAVHFQSPISFERKAPEVS